MNTQAKRVYRDESMDTIERQHNNENTLTELDFSNPSFANKNLSIPLFNEHLFQPEA